jgi:hypothetical protein
MLTTDSVSSNLPLPPQQQVQHSKQPTVITKTEPVDVFAASSRSESIRSLANPELYQNSNKQPVGLVSRERYASQSEHSNHQSTTGYSVSAQQQQQQQPQQPHQAYQNQSGNAYQYGSHNQLSQQSSQQQQHQYVDNSNQYQQQQYVPSQSDGSNAYEAGGPSSNLVAASAQFSHSSHDVSKNVHLSSQPVPPIYYPNSYTTPASASNIEYDRSGNLAGQPFSNQQQDPGNMRTYSANNLNNEYGNYNYNNNSGYQQQQPLHQVDSTRASSTSNQNTHESTPGRAFVLTNT